jgi:hypothetical protein
MVREYCGDGTTNSRLQEANEYTWPILAQQPPVFYGKAITIPIPRSALTESGTPVPKPRHPLDEDDDLWPTVDIDAAAALAEGFAVDEAANRSVAYDPKR